MVIIRKSGSRCEAEEAVANPLDGRLRDKAAIVFGGGSIGEGWGNGKAAAVAYARAGAKVAVVDIDPASAAVTRDLITAEGGVAIATEADVTSLASVEKSVAEAQGAFGRIDILHNNVGITSRGGPVETSEAVWDLVMAVNVKSMLLTCKAILPLMEARGAGTIINIGALGGVRWTGYAYCAYAASKGAVNSFTQSVALQYAAKGICANCILPGVMDTTARSRASMAAATKWWPAVTGCPRQGGWAMAGTSPMPPSSSPATRPNTSTESSSWSTGECMRAAVDYIKLNHLN
jgi:NAD(P)-dependent dehydrogenase (short-subunit alcohol dehydrogenase family)